MRHASVRHQRAAATTLATHDPPYANYVPAAPPVPRRTATHGQEGGRMPTAGNAATVLAWLRRHAVVPVAAAVRAARKRRLRATTDGGEKASTRVRLEERTVPGMQLWVPASFVDADAQLAVPPVTDARHERAIAKAAAGLQKRVLYDDGEFAVLNKPAGVACQPGGKHGQGARACISEALETGRVFPTNATRPRLVHRLDAMTTGALVVALSDNAARFFTDAFREQTAAVVDGGAAAAGTARIRKTYTAVVRASDASGAGKRNASPTRRLLGAVGGDPIALHSPVPSRGGAGASMARSTVSVLAASGCPNPSCRCTLGLISVSIQTGRKHQIRRQLAAEVQWPVLGDHPEQWRGADKADRHGGAEVGRCPLGRGCVLHGAGGAAAPPVPLYLHASRLQLDVPGNAVDIKAPLPPHFVEACTVLGWKFHAGV